MSDSPKPPMSLLLPFRWAGRDGEVRVEVGENDDPAALGCEPWARGFPVCRATIDPPARGYSDMLGWIQMVEDSYHGGGFHADGFEPLGDLPHPFGFYGVSPSLFDAPHADAENFDFLAHTFLCGLGGDLLEFRREARSVLGFSWGCVKRGAEIDFLSVEPLPAEAWNEHRDYLAQNFPQWSFPLGFTETSREP